MSQSYLTSHGPCGRCGGPQVRILRRLTDRILHFMTLGYLRQRRYQCMQCGREGTVGSAEVTPASQTKLRAK